MGKLDSLLGRGGRASRRIEKMDTDLEVAIGAIRRAAAGAGVEELEERREELLAVALNYAREDRRLGVSAFDRAADALRSVPGGRGRYLLAMYNLGSLFRDEGDADAAFGAWRCGLDDGLDLNDHLARFGRAMIEFNSADLLVQIATSTGRNELLVKAIELCRDLVDRDHDSPLEGTRERVRRAAILRGLASAELDSREQMQAAADSAASLGEEWDSDQLRQFAGMPLGIRKAAEEFFSPYSHARENNGDANADADGLPTAEEAQFEDALHQEALARLERHSRYGDPFVLLLRSFGQLKVETSSIGSIPVVSVNMPGVSFGHPLEAQLATWLEQRALVLSIANQAGMRAGPADAFPRILLGANWYEWVQTLMIEAEGIIVLATRESPGLLAEVDAIRWHARRDDTILITTEGVNPSAFGSFGHHIAWNGKHEGARSRSSSTRAAASTRAHAAAPRSAAASRRRRCRTRAQPASRGVSANGPRSAQSSRECDLTQGRSRQEQQQSACHRDGRAVHVREKACDKLWS